MALSLRTEHGAQPLVHVFQCSLLAQRLHLLHCLQAVLDVHSMKAHLHAISRLGRDAQHLQQWRLSPGRYGAASQELLISLGTCCNETRAHVRADPCAQHVWHAQCVQVDECVRPTQQRCQPGHQSVAGSSNGVLARLSSTRSLCTSKPEQFLCKSSAYPSSGRRKWVSVGQKRSDSLNSIATLFSVPIASPASATCLNLHRTRG
jgi:hypothetical protein